MKQIMKSFNLIIKYMNFSYSKQIKKISKSQIFYLFLFSQNFINSTINHEKVEKKNKLNAKFKLLSIKNQKNKCNLNIAFI